MDKKEVMKKVKEKIELFFVDVAFLSLPTLELKFKVHEFFAYAREIPALLKEVNFSQNNFGQAFFEVYPSALEDKRFVQNLKNVLFDEEFNILFKPTPAEKDQIRKEEVIPMTTIETATSPVGSTPLSEKEKERLAEEHRKHIDSLLDQVVAEQKNAGKSPEEIRLQKRFDEIQLRLNNLKAEIESLTAESFMSEEAMKEERALMTPLFKKQLQGLFDEAALIKNIPLQEEIKSLAEKFKGTTH